MTTLLAMPGNEAAAKAIAAHLGVQPTFPTVRRFPDGEAYVRLEPMAISSEVVIVCSLDRPDEKFLPLAFLAAALREHGAAHIGLVAPYLAYLRQDRVFQPGETVTSRHFARLISGIFDWLITVDPHLHRYASLAEAYSIPTRVLSAAPLIAHWIVGNVDSPLLIGPDSESAQWVHTVANDAGAPSLVLEKIRRGDNEVEVSLPTPHVANWRMHTPVLVDDIISTAHTMIETVGHLKRAGLPPPVCIGVHAVFAASAYEALLAAGAGQVVTANTIAHPSNRIDLHGMISEAIHDHTPVSGAIMGNRQQFSKP